MKTDRILIVVLIIGLLSLGGVEQNGVPKTDIDSRLCNGLTGGFTDSLCYRVEELERHFHGRERWFGKLAVQTATDWADNNIDTPYQAKSGADDYGGDANDEAQVIGTADTPAITSMTKFDIHRILIVGATETTVYKLRIVYGTGTMADAINAGQYSTIMVVVDPANGAKPAVPAEIMMPRGTAGSTKVWIQAWNVTDNATIDFYVGWHEYAG